MLLSDEGRGTGTFQKKYRVLSLLAQQRLLLCQSGF
jgi:hypothetical protein